MRRWKNALFILLVGASLAAAEPPAQPDMGSNTTPAMTPAAPEVLAPLLVVAPSSGYFRPDQPHHGPLVPPSPAQNLAMLEAGRPLFPDDLVVTSVSVLLTQLTAVYGEDAPRIAELTIRAVLKIQAAGQSASPVELMVGASQWTRPAGTRGNIPRKFAEFVGLYQRGRIEQRQDHATALSQMQPSRASTAPVPLP